MSNKIIIELCAEDRDRIDRLTGVMEARIAQVERIIADAAEKEADTTEDKVQQKLADTLANTNDPAAAPKNATEGAETSTAPVTPTTEETATAKEDATPWDPIESFAQHTEHEKAKPTVTLEQIQQKVVQLAAGNGGAKKAKVREIINAYGSKVSDLKDQPEKWTEVWDKLTALESEG